MNTAKIKMKTIKELRAKIEILTDNNEHTAAKLVVSKFFGYENYTKIFKAIDIIHDTEGHLPSWIGEYRRQKGAELMNLIKTEHGEDIFHQISKSF